MENRLENQLIKNFQQNNFLENYIDESEFNKENLKKFFNSLLFNEKGEPIKFLEE